MIKNKKFKRIVGLDFETYYDKDYSLRKMTNTSYVRDDRFKVQCVSIQTDRMKRPKNYHGKAIDKALRSIDWSTSALMCHHTQFDGFILSQHYDIVPAFYFCTLSMARPIHGGQIRNSLNELAKYYGLRNKLEDVLEKTKGVRDLPPVLQKQLGEYNDVDVEIMWGIFRRMSSVYPDDELELIHRTVAAFCDPILVIDKGICEDEHRREKRKRQRIVRETGLTLTELRSRKTFPAALIEAGGTPPRIPDPKVKGQTKITFNKDNLDFQKLFHHPNKRVRQLVKAKQIAASSIDATRALRIIEHGNPTLPIYLNYGKAHTLRWSGGDKMNPQNMRRDSKLRHAIKAPPGYKLVIVDSTSIELHVAATVAGESQLVEACRDPKRDPYCEFSSESIYHKPINKKQHGKERFVGKVGLLSLQYQTGAGKLQHTLESGAMGVAVKFSDEAMYTKIVRGYRSRYRAIVQAWSDMEIIISEMKAGRSGEYGPVQYDGKYIFLPNGLYLMYPNLRSKLNKDSGYIETFYGDGKGHKIYPGLLFNNIIQSLARIVVSEQILQVEEKYKNVLLVHDELVTCVRERSANRCYKQMMKAFHTPPKWLPELPVAGEGGIVDHYMKM